MCTSKREKGKEETSIPIISSHDVPLSHTHVQSNLSSSSPFNIRSAAHTHIDRNERTVSRSWRKAEEERKGREMCSSNEGTSLHDHEIETDSRVPRHHHRHSFALSCGSIRARDKDPKEEEQEEGMKTEGRTAREQEEEEMRASCAAAFSSFFVFFLVLLISFGIHHPPSISSLSPKSSST